MGNKKVEKAKNHLAMSNDEYKHHKAGVYKTTLLLSFVTIFEVAFAIWYEAVMVPKGWPKGLLRFVLVVLSLLKAGYIMAIFMHLKYEKKMFQATILVPFTLLIWMIIAFMMDGVSWDTFRKERFGVKEVAKTTQVDNHHSEGAHH